MTGMPHSFDAEDDPDTAATDQVQPTPQSLVTTNVVIQQATGDTGILTMLVWFICIGWWASLIWITVAWILMVLIITLPVGLLMLNTVPRIATLKAPSKELRVSVEGTTTRIREATAPQHEWWVRAIYFVVAGWWVSLFWVYAAWFASVSLIGLPLAIWMYNRVPAVTTLKRY